MKMWLLATFAEVMFKYTRVPGVLDIVQTHSVTAELERLNHAGGDWMVPESLSK